MVHRKRKFGMLCSLLLIIGVMLSLAVPAAAVSVSDFTDVSSGAWYYDAVSFVVDRGLFNGTGSSTFNPSGTMTRGMFITVLGRFANVDPDAWKAGVVSENLVNVRSGPGTSYDPIGTVNNGDIVTLNGVSGDWYKVRWNGQDGYIMTDFVSPRFHRFSDVNYSSYFAGYAIWGFEVGIVSGMGSEATFAPERNVTREQICKFLSGYIDHTGLSLAAAGSDISFSDQTSVSSWAVSAVAAMQRAGVVMGEKKDGGYVFRPRSSATRAEAAVIFQRLTEAIARLNAAIPAETTPAPAAPAAPETTKTQETETGEAEETVPLQEEAETTEGTSSAQTVYTAENVPGDYSIGSAYGEYLTETQLHELAEVAASFMNNYYDPAASDYANVKAAHDYIVNNAYYELGSDSYEAWTSWSALVRGDTNCIGYSNGFKTLCDAMGIGCYVVNSTNIAHTWNVVQVDGSWYIVDVQYDDTMSNYRYFLVSEGTYFSEGTQWDRDAVPSCPNDYDAW